MLDEARIQEILYRYLLHRRPASGNYPYIHGNCKNIFSWECDFIDVTNSGYIKEYEIKINKSDFYNDKKKQMKHFNLKNRIGKIPSQFWYVIYGFELDIDEVPEYAGLLKVVKGHRYGIEEVKKAPRLSKEKITEDQKAALVRAIYYRYWSIRLKNRGGKQRKGYLF